MLMPAVMAFHNRGSEGDRPQGQSINRGGGHHHQVKDPYDGPPTVIPVVGCMVSHRRGESTRRQWLKRAGLRRPSVGWGLLVGETNRWFAADRS
jgi:hypothetical protein